MNSLKAIQFVKETNSQINIQMKYQFFSNKSIISRQIFNFYHFP